MAGKRSNLIILNACDKFYERVSLLTIFKLQTTLFTSSWRDMSNWGEMSFLSEGCSS